MLTKTGQTKIMDFGLAKVKWSVLVTREGTTVGTAAYMSPEQSRGDKVDHRADLWSMGVIFYEMLAGKLPFKGDFEQAMMYSIMNEEVEPITGIISDLPPGIDDLIGKILSKEPADRYQDASDFLSDLRGLRDHGGVKQDVEEEKRVAVLPFENISPDKEADYFAEGLAEELIINLSRIKNVGVVARTSSMQYKGTKKDIKSIGRELRAGYIMEGSVRRFKDDLRISAQLIDVASGTQLWGETYKGKLADVFDIQEQVSREIVDALRVKLSPTEKVVLEKRSRSVQTHLTCICEGEIFYTGCRRTTFSLLSSCSRRQRSLTRVMLQPTPGWEKPTPISISSLRGIPPGWTKRLNPDLRL